jgi:type II secretory pathway pseudopilin PulG
LRPHLRGSRSRGFTLVEVVFAVFLLTVGALMLSASLSSSERMSSLARERAIANNILRAYIERLRQQYPTSQGSGDMTKLLMRGVVASGGTAALDFTTSGATPDSTPIYDLTQLYSSGLVEKGVLKNATANVYFCTDETGANWGPCVTATITAPTAVTAATVGSSMTTTDATCLGLPRDLNGDGIPYGGVSTCTVNGTTNSAQTDTYGASGANNAQHNIVLIPVKVELSWVSGNANAIGSNQKMTIYAIFSPQH